MAPLAENSRRAAGSHCDFAFPANLEILEYQFSINFKIQGIQRKSPRPAGANVRLVFSRPGLQFQWLSVSCSSTSRFYPAILFSYLPFTVKNVGTYETDIALPEKSIDGKEKCRIWSRSIRQNDTQYRSFRLFIFELIISESRNCSCRVSLPCASQSPGATFPRRCAFIPEGQSVSYCSCIFTVRKI